MSNGTLLGDLLQRKLLTGRRFSRQMTEQTGGATAGKSLREPVFVQSGEAACRGFAQRTQPVADQQVHAIHIHRHWAPAIWHSISEHNFDCADTRCLDTVGARSQTQIFYNNTRILGDGLDYLATVSICSKAGLSSQSCCSYSMLCQFWECPSFRKVPALLCC